MQTELNIHGEDYTQIIYVICRCPEQLKYNPNGWLHHHTYTDLEKAKVGLRKLLNNNPYNYSYKIRKFVGELPPAFRRVDSDARSFLVIFNSV